MTIVYVDLVAGDDDTGDGSYGNPYLTLAKGDDGLSGGDEVRVAKTTRNTLSGTLSFTEGSAAVATTADLSGVLALNDCISKDDGADEGWWHVLSVTSDTITLSNVYYGSTESGVTGYSMTPSFTGSQTVAVSGTSAASRLVVSGGWDLSTQTRDGYTCLICSTNFARALNCGSYNYLAVSYFVCMSIGEYTYPFTIIGEACYVHHMYGVCNADGDLAETHGNYSSFEYIVITGGDSYGISFGSLSVASNIYSYSSNTSGIYYNSRYNSVLSNSVVKGCGIGVYAYANSCQIYVKNCIVDACTSGVYFYSASGNGYVVDCTITNCTYAIRLSQAWETIYSVNNTFSDNTNNYFGIAQHYNPGFKGIDSAGVNFKMYNLLLVEQDSSDARSGSCMKFTPSHSSVKYIPTVELGSVKVTSVDADMVLSIYLKDNAGFNGGVILSATAGLRYVVPYAVKTLTTSYTEYTVTVAEADLVVGEYVKLYMQVYGTAGNVYADDFSATQ